MYLGQAYVALSRASSAAGLRIVNLDLGMRRPTQNLINPSPSPSPSPITLTLTRTLPGRVGKIHCARRALRFYEALENTEGVAAASDTCDQGDDF